MIPARCSMLLALSCSALVWAQAPAPAEAVSPPAQAEEPTPVVAPPQAAGAPAPAEATAAIAAPAAPAAESTRGVCDLAKDRGLPEGPVALGYADADLTVGRRACPRTEAGAGARLGAIIDSANFYGRIGVDGLVFGSFALDSRTEGFVLLNAANYSFVQNATLKQTALSLGHMTVGASRQLTATHRYAAALSGRLLLPTSFELPNARLVGAEIGHASTFRPSDLIEVHAALGGEVTAALGGPALPRFGLVLSAGLQLTPTTWFALVVDATGRVSQTVVLVAPSAALRFRVSKLGIEVGATLPLLGTDRHDVIAGARFGWRLD